MELRRGGVAGSWLWLVGGAAVVAVVAIVLALTLSGDSDGGAGPQTAAQVETSDESPDAGAAAATEEAQDARATEPDSAAEEPGGGDGGGAEPGPEDAVEDPTPAAGAESDPAEASDEAAAAPTTPTDEAEPVDAEASSSGEEGTEGTDLVPAIDVVPAQIRQGETVLVRVSGVDAGSVWLTVAGETTVMVQEGEGWIGFVPVQPLSDLGPYTVIVDLFDDVGDYADTLLSEFNVVDANVPVESITLIPGDEGLLAPELVAIDNTVRFVDHTSISGPRLWREPWISPLGGPSTGIFGALRSYNGAPPSDWHHGHDISAPEGTPIVAPAPGRVVFVGDLPVHGQGVILDHGAGVYSGYWHMSSMAAEVGAMVEAGTVLGAVGATGLAVGPHLHWELIIHGRDVDPAQWLAVAFHE